MAWGKGGSTNVVHVTTRGRRAISVPAMDISYDYMPLVGSKAARTVYAADEESHGLSRASRRSDQKLLNGIQTKLNKLEYDSIKPGRDVKVKTGFRRFIYGYKPALEDDTKVKHRLDQLKYPWANRDNIFRVPSSAHKEDLTKNKTTTKHEDVKVKEVDEEDHYPAHDPMGLYRPRVSMIKRFQPEDMELPMKKVKNRNMIDLMINLRSKMNTLSTTKYNEGSDIDNFILDMSRPLVRNGPMIMHVPRTNYEYQFQQDEGLNHDTKWMIDKSYTGITEFKRILDDSFKKHDNVFFTRGLVASPPFTVGFGGDPDDTSSSFHKNAPSPPHYPRTDDVVSHEGYYMPATRTGGFRAVNEPRRILPTASLAISQAKTSLGRIERELGMGAVSLDDSPGFDETVVHASHMVPVASSRNISTGWARGEPTTHRPNYSYDMSSRPPLAPRTTRQHEIEARLETMIVPDLSPPVSYAALRSRASDARTKMDQHKVLLDRYLPLPTGTPNEVPYEVEYRFNELAERMPQLRPRERYERASSLPPVRPLTAPTAGRTAVNDYREPSSRAMFRPTMSDTRKRAREVLCRTRRDPHYFDY